MRRLPRVGALVTIAVGRAGSGPMGITSPRPDGQLALVTHHSEHGEAFVVWSATPGMADGDWFQPSDLARPTRRAAS